MSSIDITDLQTATMRRITLVATALLFAQDQAMATGSEMSGLKMVVPVTLSLGALLLLLLVWLIAARLPQVWSRLRRWCTALVLAPLGLGAIVLVLSGPNAVNMLVARFMTP
jgi:hypothetical protein